jgi:aerobic carbon-monoxide dehydrogenase medium subunit
MKPAPFEWHGPERLDEALSLLSSYGDEAKALAGGQSLVPMLALRLARFDHLVDLNRIPELSGVSCSNGSLRVGAMTRHRTVEYSDDVATAVPLLARATTQVGHFQIRNRGTVGGAVAHADPAAEQPAVCLALDAVMEVASSRGRRDVDAASFFQGTWATAVGPDELLVALRFPIWSGRCGFAVEEVARRHGDFALAGVVCGVAVDANGAVERAAVALFGVGGTPVRASGAEGALLAGSPPDEVVQAAREGLHPPEDLHATSSYRSRVAGVLVGRAVATALEEALAVPATGDQGG